MTYEKPEIAVLGDANLLIKGGSSKANQGESGTSNPIVPLDCELDD